MTTEELDWVSAEARSRYESQASLFEAVRREAITTLALSVGIASGALGFAVDAAASGPAWVAASAGVFAAYIGLIAVTLVVLGLRTSDYYPMSNDPKHLAAPLQSGEFTLEAVREVELENMQERIDFNRTRGDRLGATLNGAWIALAVAPMVWAVSAVVLRAVG